MRKSGLMLLVFILVGGLLGGVLGEILRVLTPPGTVQNIFAKAIMLGLDPPLNFELFMLKLTFGFVFKINLLTLLGIFLGIYLYKNL